MHSYSEACSQKEQIRQVVVPVVELELSSVAGTVVLVFVTGACYTKIFSKYSWIETVPSSGELLYISLGWSAVHFHVMACYLLLCP